MKNRNGDESDAGDDSTARVNSGSTDYDRTKS